MVVRAYSRWLHTQFPAGVPEPLPQMEEDGSTAVPGVFVVGDLTGVPLLKFAADSGARIARRIAEESKSWGQAPAEIFDVAIVGGGVAGCAAAIEAHRRGLKYVLLESSKPFATIIDFPARKPIYTYPMEMDPAGELKVTADVKEKLVEELESQIRAAQIRVTPGRVEQIERDGEWLLLPLQKGDPIRARRVIVAIGRSGEFRSLGVKGEDLPKVYHRLHDPKEAAGKRVLVVGGGDSALETAIAIAKEGGAVTLSYRKAEFARPKPDNVEALEKLKHRTAEPGRVRMLLPSEVKEIREGEVMISHGGSVETVPNDLVYLMIGRAAPLDFFRKSGIPIVGEWSAAKVLTFLAFLLFCLWLYPAKSGKVPDEFAGGIGAWINAPPKALDQWLAPNVSAKQGHGAPTPDHRVAAVWRRSENRAVLVPSDSKEAMESTSPYYINTSFGGVLAESAKSIGFWYSLAYCVLVAVFGWKRYQKRRTPYVKLQTISLAAIQIVPLFLLPYAVLPYLGLHEMLPRTFLDWFFPEVNYGHGREYWRAFGFVLAWPLFFFNWLTSAPLLPWLILGAIQTFVLIPGLVYFFGKGAYCGWICSCGALAETLGDAHRQKMPHGPVWNRLNMAGQAILALAAALMVWRVAGWLAPKGSWIETTMPIFSIVEKANYWVVDAGLAGIVGVGFYFWYSGRVWCRFFCPLAALMHIYARFSQFRILADKKKCISCNACTSICHQGIDVMAFANKGKPMNDPECVRCSACVSTCPTGTLQFGRVGANGEVISSEILAGNLLRIAGRE